MNNLQTTAPDIVRDARQLFLAYKTSATKPSKAENLEKLWEALESIRDGGENDYSLAEIGRRLALVNGPKTQSLRNSQGGQYREIINAYAKAMNGSLKYTSKTKSSVDQALDLISDPSIKAVLKSALEEAKHLKTRNDNLHAAFKSLSIGAGFSSEKRLTSIDIGETSQQTAAPQLTSQFINALKKGIDSTRMAQQGLTLAPDGSIENEYGDKLFPPAFVSAIQSILLQVK